MAKQRIINTKFWSDEYIQELSITEKYLYLYLLTNEHTNIAGMYEISLKTISFETDIPKDRLSKAINKLSKDGKILYKKGWIVLGNFVKNQNINEKVKTGIKRIIDSLPDWLKDKITIDYDSLCIEYDIPELKLELEPELKSKDHIPTLDEFLKYGKELCKKTNKDYKELFFSLETKYKTWKESNWKDGHNKKIKNWKLKLNSTFPYLKEIKSHGESINDLPDF